MAKQAPHITAEFDGKLTVSYMVNGTKSAFRVLPEMGRLIAAAPELLKALKCAWPYVANLEHKTDKSNEVDLLCQKVIARVEGLPNA